MGRVAIQAFAGLFLGGMILGLIYSTLLAFFLAKRQSTNYTD
jgi:tetrahydromethanopterin S-methyltransferase subunit B